MPIVRARLICSPLDNEEQDVVELDLEVTEEFRQHVINRTLRKFDLGPFEEGGIKFVFYRFAEGTTPPVVELIPAPH